MNAFSRICDRNLLAEVERGGPVLCSLTGPRVLRVAPLLTVSPRNGPSTFTKDHAITRPCRRILAPPTWWSYVASLLNDSLRWHATVLQLPLSPVSSRTFIASKRNSLHLAHLHTPIAPLLCAALGTYTHRWTGQRRLKRGIQGYTLPCPT